MPLGIDQGVGAMIWSPLGWGRLSGKMRRGQPLPADSRLNNLQWGVPVVEERLFRVLDAIDVVAAETGKTVPQVAIAWLLARHTVSSVIIGARNETQLRDNLGAVGWSLSPEQVQQLDEASAVMPAYPYFSYRIEKSYKRLNPPSV